METALQKGEFLRNNDPLLISPITDLDFLIEKKIVLVILVYLI